MSEEEAMKLDTLVSLSGLAKQDYIEFRPYEPERHRLSQFLYCAILVLLDAVYLSRACRRV